MKFDKLMQIKTCLKNNQMYEPCIDLIRVKSNKNVDSIEIESPTCIIFFLFVPRLCVAAPFYRHGAL